ncbi:MAG: abortive infection family protein [Bacteroidota bacterium]
MNDSELLEVVETFQNLLVDAATYRENEEGEYESIRKRLMAAPEIRDQLPRFVKTCRSEGQFWSFIKRKSGKYEGRREFIWDAFRPLLAKLDGTGTSPSDTRVTEALKVIDAEHVQAAWEKALERRHEDPEGAITAARTLIETVCKHVLDEQEEEYDDGADLPVLYRTATKSLNLAPEQHQEQIFKQILSGCFSVVSGLGAVRNKLSDAHGRGKRAVKPSARHAELAVNLSGAMAAFLLATWETQKHA